MSRDAGLAHLDTYLAQVGRRLNGLPEAEARETLAELRSHVLDRAAGDLSPASVEAAIAALGSPRDVARLNVTERVATHVEADRSPISVVRAIGRLAGLSLYGFFAFLVTLTGYMTAAAFLITAAVKPFLPKQAGLWWITRADDPLTFSLGVVDHAPAGRELLGWWIIPLGIAVGIGLGLLTWRFGLFSVRLMARTARRGRTRPA